MRRELIRELAYFNFRRKVTKVVVYGEHGEDRELREVMAEVLAETGMTPSWVEDTVNSTFAGAFGAAEFSKRQPYWSGKDGWPSSAKPAWSASHEQKLLPQAQVTTTTDLANRIWRKRFSQDNG